MYLGLVPFALALDLADFLLDYLGWRRGVMVLRRVCVSGALGLVILATALQLGAVAVAVAVDAATKNVAPHHPLAILFSLLCSPSSSLSPLSPLSSVFSSSPSPSSLHPSEFRNSTESILTFSVKYEIEVEFGILSALRGVFKSLVLLMVSLSIIAARLAMFLFLILSIMNPAVMVILFIAISLN